MKYLEEDCGHVKESFEFQFVINNDRANQLGLLLIFPLYCYQLLRVTKIHKLVIIHEKWTHMFSFQSHIHKVLHEEYLFPRN